MLIPVQHSLCWLCSTGVKMTHQEFLYDPSLNISGSRAIHGWLAIGVPSNSDDCMGHGTHVSGTIGGLTYGVAKKAAGLRSFRRAETDLQDSLKICLQPVAQAVHLLVFVLALTTDFRD
ncbi:TPA: hypothetical protein ACH3X1_011534 [Trebouxia sp. C0004]